MDQVDEQGREKVLASWQKTKNKPYSSTSIKEIVKNFYNRFQILCDKWQKMQEKLPTKPAEIFELTSTRITFSSVRQVLDKRDGLISCQAIRSGEAHFCDHSRNVLKCRERWPEYHGKEKQKEVLQQRHYPNCAHTKSAQLKLKSKSCRSKQT